MNNCTQNIRLFIAILLLNCLFPLLLTHASTISLPQLNVKDYGAKGDGQTDDTQAIQSAFNDWWKVEPNGQIYFPTGNYLLSSSIYANITCAEFDISIYGDGPEESQIWQSSYQGVNSLIFEAAQCSPQPYQSLSTTNLQLLSQSATPPMFVGAISVTGLAKYTAENIIIAVTQPQTMSIGLQLNSIDTIILQTVVVLNMSGIYISPTLSSAQLTDIHLEYDWAVAGPLEVGIHVNAVSGHTFSMRMHTIYMC